VLSCFTSSVHRIQIVLDLARTTPPSGIAGRSMLRNVEIAESLRQLDVPDVYSSARRRLARWTTINCCCLRLDVRGPDVRDDKIATDQHKNLSVGEGDTVCFPHGNTRQTSRDFTIDLALLQARRAGD